MKPLRRKTRETFRHERAVVLQQITAPTTAEVRADWERNKARAAALRRRVDREGNNT